MGVERLAEGEAKHATERARVNCEGVAVRLAPGGRVARVEADTVGELGTMSDLGTSVERAAFYDEAAAEAEAQGATIFTDDAVFAAVGRLVEVLTAKLLEASHVRSDRLAPKAQRRRVFRL